MRQVHMYNASNMTKLRNFKKAFSTKVIKLSKNLKFPYKIGELQERPNMDWNPTCNKIKATINELLDEPGNTEKYILANIKNKVKARQKSITLIKG